MECLAEPEKYLVVATSRTDDVLFYGYHPPSQKLELMGQIQVG